MTLEDEACGGPAMESLVRFMYAGKLRVEGALDLVHLFRVARFLQVASLQVNQLCRMLHSVPVTLLTLLPCQGKIVVSYMYSSHPRLRDHRRHLRTDCLRCLTPRRERICLFWRTARAAGGSSMHVMCMRCRTLRRWPHLCRLLTVSDFFAMLSPCGCCSMRMHESTTACSQIQRITNTHVRASS